MPAPSGDIPYTTRVSSAPIHQLLNNLNPPQRAAVTHEGGPLLIFAGAGSGKTRTLTHRIGYLIRHHRVPPWRILAVTFTNKAAREMQERLHALVGDDARHIWMGTFHRLCGQMLRMHGDRIGVSPQYTIFDTDDGARLMRQLLHDANLDPTRYAPARILNRISDEKNNLRTPADTVAQAASPYDRAVARLYVAYQERLQQLGGLDFDDLLVQAVRLLQQDEATLEYWRERFLHVLIDEFQDVNLAQFSWAELLASKHRHLCAVGDDDQAIYAWRGANVQIILGFQSSFPDATIIHLEQNYRSTQPILDAGHDVISLNDSRQPKKLWTERTGSELLELHCAANADEEADWVVKKVQALLRTGERNPSDFAILCRINAQSRPFEAAFTRHRMPLRLVGTQRFYERREIKDLVCYLRVLANPADDLALARIINVPARGIGAVTLAALQELAEVWQQSLSTTATAPEMAAEFPPLAAARLAEFARLLASLRRHWTAQDSVAALLKELVRLLDYHEFLLSKGAMDGVDRMANVEEFIGTAVAFDEQWQQQQAARLASEAETGQPDTRSGLQVFLEGVALADNGGNSEAGPQEAVQLLTLHSAKGLEFPVVFIVGVEQGLLPHARALWGEGNLGETLAEERRLLYVGITRAQDRVFLSHARERMLRGRTEPAQLSQFVQDISPHLLERTGLAESSRSAITSWSPGIPTAARPALQQLEADRVPCTYQVGDRLRHPTFGEGLVLNTSHCGGANEWVEVAFLQSGAGKKKLVLAYAPLEKV